MQGRLPDDVRPRADLTFGMSWIGSKEAADLAWDFLQNATSSCTSLEMLNARFARVVRAFGFTSAAYIRLARNGEPVPPTYVFGDPYQEWSDRYFERGYADYDNVLSLAYGARAPFTWAEAEARSDLAQTRSVFGEAREIWQPEMLVCPVRGAFGDLAIVNLGMPKTLNPKPDERATIHALCSLYAVLGEAFLEQDEPPEPRMQPLTRREREVLYWVAVSKTDFEIGRILSISPRTAHHHVESMKRKLGVNTRLQLVLRGFTLGLIPPPAL